MTPEEKKWLQGLNAEQRLREISRQWAVRTNQGYPFFNMKSDVPRMRILLEGYTHPDELPEDDDG